MTPWHRYPKLAYLAVFIAVCGHASSEFVSVLTGLGGPETSVWRFGLGGAGLVVIALCLPASRDLITPLRQDGARFVGLSALGVMLSYLAFHWSLDFATVPQVATMVTTIPIFVAITAAIVDRTGLAGVKIVTGALAFLGVALLVTDGYLGELAGSERNLFGIGLVIFNAATTAFYLVLMRPLVRGYGALRATAISLMIGGVGLWFLVGMIWGNWVDFTRLTAEPKSVLAAIVVLALFNTTLTQFLWIGGLAAVPDMARGASLFFLKPAIAAILAVAFLAETLSVFQLLAMALICSTVLIEMIVKTRI